MGLTAHDYALEAMRTRGFSEELKMRSLLQHWVTEQAERRPEAVALVMNEERVTYGQLEESSNRLARLLKSAGCKKGDRVCFLIPKSPAAYLSMLGILKADCIHVPMDTSSPAPRLTRCELRSSLRLLSVSIPLEASTDNLGDNVRRKGDWSGEGPPDGGTM